MQVSVTEKGVPKISSKLVLKGLENMGDLRISGILGDGNFLVIPMLPWCGSRTIKYGHQGAERTLDNHTEFLLP